MKPGRLLCLAALAVTPLAAGCGSRGVSVAQSDPDHAGAVLFAERCGGCHTLDAAGTQGSATKVRDRERVDGPNFNTRSEEVDQVLYAIRNGGFSGAIMPENIVVGEDAQKVAEFLAKYAGKKESSSRASGEQPDTGGSAGGP
jgi:mono/diheme cytochrome c family protein